MKEYVPSKQRTGKPAAATGTREGRKRAATPTARPTSPNGRGSRATGNLTPLAIVFRYIKPHWRDYIGYVRMAVREGDTRMLPFMDAWDKLTKQEQRRLMPEDVCELSGVMPSALGGVVAEYVLSAGMNASQILAGVEHPRVMEAIAKRAVRKEGHADGELFLRATGSLPDRKGASIVVNNTPVALAAGRSAHGRADDSITDAGAGVGGFRSVSGAITKMDRLLGGAGQGPAVRTDGRDRAEAIDIGDYTEVVPDSEIDLPDDADDDQ